MKHILLFILVICVNKSLELKMPPRNRNTELFNNNAASRCSAAYFYSKNGRCEPQSCTHKVSNGIYKFPIYDENKELAIYYISYDSNKKQPQYSIALHDKLNSQIDEGRDATHFVQHPCNELKSLQRKAKNEFFTDKGYQTGHLTPYKAMSISKFAQKSTNLYINAAPQDAFTNVGSWSSCVERKVYDLLSTRHGIVITGVCNNIRTTSEMSKQPFEVPECFWKLICFKENQQTIVFGYYAENTPVGKTQGLKEQRKNSVCQVRSQREIIEKTKLGDRIKLAWEESNILRESRRSFINNLDSNYPKLYDCINARENNNFDQKKVDQLIVESKRDGQIKRPWDNRIRENEKKKNRFDDLNSRREDSRKRTFDQFNDYKTDSRLKPRIDFIN